MSSPVTAKRVHRTPRPPVVTATLRSLSSNTQRADTSRQIDPDYTLGALGGTSPLDPPYQLSSLSTIFGQSNMLQQCAESYVTNIAMYGWEIVAASENTPIDRDEELLLQTFIDSPNSDESLRTIHANTVFFYEKFGHSYVEFIRDRKGRVSILRTAPPATIGVCPKSDVDVTVHYDVARGPRIVQVTEIKKFRIYRQQQGGKFVFFKEFGDPRKLDFRTGLFESPDNPVAPEFEATELLHFRQLSEDVYGVPRWLSQLPSILGSRESEEVNLRYFEDNTVPPMILSVAGGRLTGESFRQLKEVLNARSVGKERQNQIMLLEAVAERESLDDKGSTVTLKVDKLTDTRPQDALFTEYDAANQAKIRSAFRLPPVSVGLSQDITFATANVSTFVAETQVFGPERTKYDEVWNKRFVQHPQGLNLKTVALRSKSPVVTNPEILIRSLTALNVMGAVTPRLARIAANDILQINLDPYPEKGDEGYEPWMDEPLIFATKTNSGNEGIDPAGKGNTHAGQEIKPDDVKELELDGDPSMQAPEHGSE
jgi:PBSX family phage portal protein